MLIEKSMNDEWVSNTYLVADGPGGSGVLIDAGGPVAPLLETIEREGIDLTHVLLTHHHHDHVAELDAVLQAHPGVPVLAHPFERERVMGATGDLDPEGTITSGDLEIAFLHTPGHTAGMLNPLVNGHLFTGDTLFKGSVGGVRAPGHTSYADIKRSIMETLMTLPPETVVHPGHTDPTTIGEEWEGNAFVRVWRGEDPEGDQACTALGDPATLVLLAPDYDGGKKAWVRWADGSDDIVPGSQVQPA